MILGHDIVMVGGGGAGLRAAISIAETNPHLSIAVVSKVYPMRSHTVSAEGGAAAVAREDDNFELHGYDTVKGSDFLGDQDVIQYFVEEAPKEVKEGVSKEEAEKLKEQLEGAGATVEIK